MTFLTPWPRWRLSRKWHLTERRFWSIESCLSSITRFGKDFPESCPCLLPGNQAVQSTNRKCRKAKLFYSKAQNLANAAAAYFPFLTSSSRTVVDDITGCGNLIRSLSVWFLVRRGPFDILRLPVVETVRRAVGCFVASVWFRWRTCAPLSLYNRNFVVVSTSHIRVNFSNHTGTWVHDTDKTSPPLTAVNFPWLQMKFHFELLIKLTKQLKITTNLLPFFYWIILCIS